jgi:hypothetical protein
MEHNLILMFVTPLSSQNVNPIQLDVVICMAALTGFKGYQIVNLAFVPTQVSNAHNESENEKINMYWCAAYTAVFYSSVKLHVRVNSFVHTTRFHRNVTAINVKEQVILGDK